VRERREHYFNDAVEYVAEHIRQGQRQGWVRPLADPDLTALWLCGMADRGVITTIRHASEHQLKALATSLTDVIWHTLYEGYRDPDGSRDQGARDSSEP
jgi:hypothetical protein